MLFAHLYSAAPFTKWVLAVSLGLALAVHLGSRRASHDGHRNRLLLRTLEAFFWTICTLFLSSDLVQSGDELTRVALGWPFDFVIQDQSRFDPPYPWPMGWAWEVPSAWIENGALRFIASWAVVFGLVSSGHWLLDWARRYAGRSVCNLPS